MSRSLTSPTFQQQRGVVLLLALIMVVAMTLAGIALYRQMGTGVIVARNLTFKSTAIVAADRGIELARAWIAPLPATCDDACKAAKAAELLEPRQASGRWFYYPAWCYTSDPASRSRSAAPINCGKPIDPGGSGDSPAVDFDPLTYDWTESAIATADDGNGSEVRYVIHRLCALPGGISIVDTVGQRCASIGVAPPAQAQNAVGYGGTGLSIINMPYYRITVRVQGTLNTQAFTQAIIY